jgi:hypothetical protein
MDMLVVFGNYSLLLNLMSTTVTLISPASAADDFIAGIEWTDATGTARRAVYTSLQGFAHMVSIGWGMYVRSQLVAGLAWSADSSAICEALRVDNENYRKLATLALVPDEEATNPDGTVKAGYIGEHNLFLGAFASKTIPVPFGINYFVQDALVRKVNILYPEQDLVMPG